MWTVESCWWRRLQRGNDGISSYWTPTSASCFCLSACLNGVRVECVKYTDSTTSVHLAVRTSSGLCSSAVAVASMSSLVLAKQVVSAVDASGDVVFVEATWDVLLRCAYKHVAIRCVCGVRVISFGFGRPDVLI